jgi:hypothetical protein
MKRSEMLDKLYNVLALYTSPEVDPIYAAREVLTMIEKAGMGLPYHPTLGYDAVESHGTGTLTHYRKRIRQWEDE